MRTIALDFDDTLIPMRHAVAQEMNKLYGTDLSSETCPEFHVSRKWNYSDETFMTWFAKYEPQLHEYPPYEGLKETLEEWAKNAKLIVITARPDFQIGSARAWIKKNDLPIAEIFSACGNVTKAQVAQEQHVDLFVEDHPMHATRIANVGIKVILLSKAYNGECRHDNITRVKDWEEIRTLFANNFSPRRHGGTEEGKERK